MDDIKGFVKQYWPYILGAVVGLYLILRFAAGGGGSSSGGDGGYAAYLQAQTAAGSQNAALQLQANMQAAQIAAERQTAADKNALDNKALDAQIAINLQSLEVTKQKNYSDAFNTFQATQAAMAQAIGSSTAGVLDALNKPAITAMQAGALENMAALEAAGNVAAQSFLAQGGVVEASSAAAAEVTKGLGSILQGIAGLASQPRQPSALENIATEVAGTAAGYYTGGLLSGNRAMNGSMWGGYGSGYYSGGMTNWGF